MGLRPTQDKLFPLLHIHTPKGKQKAFGFVPGNASVLHISRGDAGERFGRNMERAMSDSKMKSEIAELERGAMKAKIIDSKYEGLELHTKRLEHGSWDSFPVDDEFLILIRDLINKYFEVTNGDKQNGGPEPKQV